MSSKRDPSVPADRSALMSRVGQKNTKPELTVRRILHSLGLRFRLHRRDLPGTPDIVLPRFRKAIFVHGCFWHRHPGCPKASMPSTRREFWTEKFERNVERDARKERELRAAGWDVHTVWECQTKNTDDLRSRLVGWFHPFDPELAETGTGDRLEVVSRRDECSET